MMKMLKTKKKKPILDLSLFGKVTLKKSAPVVNFFGLPYITNANELSKSKGWEKVFQWLFFTIPTFISLGAKIISDTSAETKKLHIVNKNKKTKIVSYPLFIQKLNQRITESCTSAVLKNNAILSQTPKRTKKQRFAIQYKLNIEDAQKFEAFNGKPMDLSGVNGNFTFEYRFSKPKSKLAKKRTEWINRSAYEFFCIFFASSLTYSLFYMIYVKKSTFSIPAPNIPNELKGLMDYVNFVTQHLSLPVEILINALNVIIPATAKLFLGEKNPHLSFFYMFVLAYIVVYSVSASIPKKFIDIIYLRPDSVIVSLIFFNWFRTFFGFYKGSWLKTGIALVDAFVSPLKALVTSIFQLVISLSLGPIVMLFVIIVYFVISSGIVHGGKLFRFCTESIEFLEKPSEDSWQINDLFQFHIYPVFLWCIFLLFFIYKLVELSILFPPMKDKLPIRPKPIPKPFPVDPKFPIPKPFPVDPKFPITTPLPIDPSKPLPIDPSIVSKPNLNYFTYIMYPFIGSAVLICAAGVVYYKDYINKINEVYKKSLELTTTNQLL